MFVLFYVILYYYLGVLPCETENVNWQEVQDWMYVHQMKPTSLWIDNQFILLGAIQIYRDHPRGRGGVLQMIADDHARGGGGSPNDHR